MKMFIYCNDASHLKLVAVTNFVEDRGRWREEFTRRGADESGQTIRADDRPATADDFLAEDPGHGVRSRYRLECRKCHRPMVVREPVLFDALSKASDAGLRSLDLAGLAAIVARSSGA